MAGGHGEDECTLYVWPLSANVTLEHVQEVFGHFGKVKSVEVKTFDKDESKRYGVVDFENQEDAKHCQSHMNEGEIDGLKVRVAFNRP